MLDSSYALVDNDFLSHALETRFDSEKLCTILQAIFDALDKQPVVHPWLATYELITDNGLVLKVISENIIQLASWEDIHANQEEQKTYYAILFKELYKKVYGISLSVPDVFTYSVKRQSLGELHNITTCMICGCNLILSDDSDSKRFKRIISQTAVCDFVVYNREELVERIRGLEGAPKRSDLKAFSHVAH